LSFDLIIFGITVYNTPV